MLIASFYFRVLLFGTLCLSLFRGIAVAQGTLVNGANQTGTITSGSQTDVYTFSGNAGDYVVLTISETGTNNTTFFPEVDLYEPGVSGYSGAEGDLGARLNGTLSVSGTMTVKVRNDGNNAMTGTGGYSVTLFHFPATTFTISSGDQGGPISAFGANITGTISRADADPWTFTASAGDSIMIGLSKVGNTTYYPRFCLFSPAGVSMGCRQDSTVGSENYYNNLSASGTYTILVDSQNAYTDFTDQYTLTIMKMTGVLTIADDGGTLTPGIDASGTLSRADLDPWTFHANSGDVFTLQLNEVDGDTSWTPVLYLWGPTGTFYGGFNTDSLNAQGTFTAPATGTYTAIVADFGTLTDFTTSYELSIAGPAGDTGLPPITGKMSGCTCDTAEHKAAPSPAVGGPITIATGNMWERIVDYETNGPNKLSFIRYYDSMENGLTTYAASLGVNWRHNYDRYIQIISGSSVTVERADGQTLNFTLSGGVWKPDTDVDLRLTESGTTWILTDQDDTVETYTASGSKAVLESIKLRNGYTQTMTYTSGLLTKVTDSYSRTLTIGYTGSFIQTVTMPDGLIITYGYYAPSSSYTLYDVSYNTSPATHVYYKYENVDHPYALTGVTDENGARYKTWTYDAAGRATMSELNGGAEHVAVDYDDASSTRVVTNALGQAETYKFATLQGVPKLTEIDRQATSTTAAATRLFTYDTNGYLATVTDWDGNSTHYTNNSYGLPTTIVEAYGSTIARTTTIVYDTIWVRLPHTVTTPGLTTTYNYDSTAGNLLTLVEADTTTTTVPYSTGGQTRTWTYTYTGTGQLQTVKLPRTDVTAKTTYGYIGGTLTSITDALSHTTSINTYTNGGYPLTITDPNGVLTTLTYDARMHMLTSVLTTGAGNLTTTYKYDNAENLIKKTLPDNSYLSYGYDLAHRLTSITNSLGESIPLTLDANDDVIQTLWKNASNTTVRQHTATFDALGRKLTDVGGMSQTTTYAYDSQGNRTSIQTPLTWTTTQTPDALNRLKTITDPYSHTTGYTYDPHNRPLTVTDPNGHVTTYVYDGFGEAISVASPDSGTTVYHYDMDGNVSSKTDAASQVTNYTYDTADRILARTYPADSAENVAYTYDQTGHGKGVTRLTTLTDAAGSLSLTYDERGNILTNGRTIAGTAYTTTYTYDNASRVASITYPTAGWLVTYTRDTSGQVTGITTTQPGHTAVNLVTSVTHEPFGPFKSLTWGNGVTDARTFDLDWRMSNLVDTGTAALQSLTYGFDADNNLLTITDAVTAANSQTLTYDHLERLTGAVSGTGGYGTLSYGYDNNGNRTSAGSTSYTIDPNSNKLTAIGSTSVSYLGTGNISAIGTASMTYNKANQLATASAGGSSATYTYDAFGQRLKVQPPGVPLQVYSYDRTGDMLTETDNRIEYDYVYLDNQPIAVIVPSTAVISYIHPDHLGTPQRATNASKSSVWSAQYQPFGSTTPSSSITQNLRLPGQYADNTGYFHNGFRDYDPAIGRYLQSDPTGLAAGMNTYAYANSNPGVFTDLLGLNTYGLGGSINASSGTQESSAFELTFSNSTTGSWLDSRVGYAYSVGLGASTGFGPAGGFVYTWSKAPSVQNWAGFSYSYGFSLSSQQEALTLGYDRGNLSYPDQRSSAEQLCSNGDPNANSTNTLFFGRGLKDTSLHIPGELHFVPSYTTSNDISVREVLTNAINQISSPGFLFRF